MTKTPAEPILRDRVQTFLEAPGQRGLLEVLAPLMQADRRLVLFGGCLRDLMLSGSEAIPRDLDLVSDGVDIDDLAKMFGAYGVRRTRFGGLHLHCQGWMVDLWPLKSTWALQRGLVAPATFANLPRTTFLDIEAVAAEILSPSGQAGEVYSCGFFPALERGQAEINLRENPFPALCVVRSLVLLDQIGFAAGPRLRAYLLEHGNRLTDEELRATQRSHYGLEVQPPESLRRVLARLTGVAAFAR